MPEQVQDFYPTPGTLSTAMYYLEFDPRTGEKVYVPKSPHEKAMQRALMQYAMPRNYDLVKEALLKAHRNDLIGYGRHCLIPPQKPEEKPSFGKAGGKGNGKPSGMGNPKGDNRQKSAAKQKESSKKTIRNVHKKKRDVH